MKEQYDHPRENKKNTLIINYPVMKAGGIETSFVGLMKACIGKGCRVIWITSERFLSQVGFEGLLDNPGLEIVLTRPWLHFLDTPRISLTEDERVIMFTCEPLEYIVSDKIRTKAGTKQFQHYLTVPHFTGNEYFPDRYLKHSGLQKLAHRYLKRILRRMAESDCILGFGPKHLAAYEEHYEIPLPDKFAKIVPHFEAELFSCDVENAKARCAERNEKFVITSCARLEFPHKAYMLGLVEAFAKVKQKYPQAVLQIIGYGSGQQELENKIMALPESVRRDIHMVGMVTPEVLEEYYKNSQLIVGLAGAIINGARCGIPSLVVRHYDYNCEAYGFFGDVPEKTLSEEPGQDVVAFIEDCITMDPETYLHHVEKARRVIVNYENHGTASLTERFEKTEKQCPKFVKNPWESVAAKLLYITCNILKRF